jgi:hypothetical protein
LKEGAEGDRDVNGEKLDIDKEFKSDDGSKDRCQQTWQI